MTDLTAFVTVAAIVLAGAAALALWLYTIWDLSRRRDISALQRWVWFVVSVVAPVIGVAAYWILRPRRSIRPPIR